LVSSEKQEEGDMNGNGKEPSFDEGISSPVAWVISVKVPINQTWMEDMT